MKNPEDLPDKNQDEMTSPPTDLNSKPELEKNAVEPASVENNSKSKKDGWLTDTRKAIITLLATPLTVATTIYFTNWIKAAKPEIQFVIWTKYKEGFAPSDKIKEKINSNGLLASTIREHLGMINASVCIDWLNNTGAWNDECQKAFYRVSFEVIGRLQDLLNEKQSRQTGRLGSFIPVSQEQIDENIQAITTIREFQKELEINGRKEPSYTGAVDFNVGVLNSGDADGVVYDTATLKFNDKKITLYADDFTAVKAHSFVKVVFPAPLFYQNKFSGNFNEKDTLNIKEWTSLIKKNTSVPIEIEITFNGKNMKYSESVGQ